MQPMPVGPDTERGYYIVWDTATWSRQRVSSSLFVFHDNAQAHSFQRDMMLSYQELESLPDANAPAPAHT